MPLETCRYQVHTGSKVIPGAKGKGSGLGSFVTAEAAALCRARWLAAPAPRAELAAAAPAARSTPAACAAGAAGAAESGQRSLSDSGVWTALGQRLPGQRLPGQKSRSGRHASGPRFLESAQSEDLELKRALEESRRDLVLEESRRHGTPKSDHRGQGCQGARSARVLVSGWHQAAART